MKDFLASFKEIREAKGITQSYINNTTGLHFATMRAFDTAESTPHDRTICRYAEAIGIPWEDALCTYLAIQYREKTGEDLTEYTPTLDILPKDKTLEGVGATLREVRLSKGFNQTDVAYHVGVTQGVVTKIETAHTSTRRMPPAIVVLRFAILLGLDWERFCVDYVSGIMEEGEWD